MSDVLLSIGNKVIKIHGHVYQNGDDKWGRRIGRHVNFIYSLVTLVLCVVCIVLWTVLPDRHDTDE